MQHAAWSTQRATFERMRMRTMTLAISSAESDVSACDCFMTRRTTRARRPHAACRVHAACTPRACRVHIGWRVVRPRGRCMDRWTLRGTWDGGVSPTYLHDEGHVPHIPARSMERADALGLVSLEVPAAPRVPTVGYRLRACMQGCVRERARASGRACAAVVRRTAVLRRNARAFARVRRRVRWHALWPM